ncbi:MAG TPA: right-handed parallel beta-helix repeat-containing protein [Candidatus Angelobacter sp.]|nr:right-handed parallel beta-helix repeat-containing protein [Candidatus Angelobacter sp.]
MRLKSMWALGILAAIGSLGVILHSSRMRSGVAALASESAGSAVPWGPLAGRNYYVSPSGRDDQDGSAARPWATLQFAATKAGLGATVHVLPGLYRGPVRTQRSGEGHARIRFLSEKQWQARIIAIGEPIVWRNDGNYVDIAGFDISGDGAQGILNMGSNVRIVGNHVHDIPAAGCTPAGGAGIDNGSESGHDNDIIGNVVNRIGDPVRECTRVHGIYHANFGGHIWNNISCDNQGWGIHLWHEPQSVVIANNLICRNHHGGIVIGAGDSPNALPADHMLVTNNILFGNGPAGSEYAIYESGLLGDDNHYLNNLVFGREQRIILQNGNQISGTIWKDPLLVNYKGDDPADFRLSPGSPAIGAGTNSGAPPMAMDGGARPVDGRWDIGPYQYQSHGKPWPWY